MGRKVGFKLGFKEPVMSPSDKSGGERSLDWYDLGVTYVLTVLKALRWADRIQNGVRRRVMTTLVSVISGFPEGWVKGKVNSSPPDSL